MRSVRLRSENRGLTVSLVSPVATSSHTVSHTAFADPHRAGSKSDGYETLTTPSPAWSASPFRSATSRGGVYPQVAHAYVHTVVRRISALVARLGGASPTRATGRAEQTTAASELVSSAESDEVRVVGVVVPLQRAAKGLNVGVVAAKVRELVREGKREILTPLVSRLGTLPRPRH